MDSVMNYERRSSTSFRAVSVENWNWISLFEETLPQQTLFWKMQSGWRFSFSFTGLRSKFRLQRCITDLEVCLALFFDSNVSQRYQKRDIKSCIWLESGQYDHLIGQNFVYNIWTFPPPVRHKGFGDEKPHERHTTTLLHGRLYVA